MPMLASKNGLIASACLLLFAAVVLGAFGAHALRDQLEASGRLEAWETAVHYHLAHGVALFAAGLFAAARPDVLSSKTFMLGVRCMGAGIILFSGSLYVLGLGGPSWLGPLTPVGGLFFLASWAALGIWSLTAGREP